MDNHGGKEKKEVYRDEDFETLLLSAAFLVFMTGASMAQAAKPEHPTKTEHPKAEEKKPEHPKAEEKKPEHPKPRKRNPNIPRPLPRSLSIRSKVHIVLGGSVQLLGNHL